LSTPVISFSETVKDYGRKTIGPVNLSIGHGEIFGFLGPNGSGKTTCIRMLLGLARPNSGAVRLNSVDPLRRHVEALKGVGYSPELPNVQSFLTPRGLLRLTASEIDFDGRALTSEIESILESVGLIEYSDVKVSKLSKGMVQRLSVAQALIGRPSVLVMDEPMLGLDPAGSAHLRELFKTFAREGGTIFLSSHMMNEVEDLCSYVAMIHSGAMLFNGPTKEMASQFLEADELIVEANGVSAEVLSSIRQLDGVLTLTEANGTLRISVRHDSELRPRLAKVIVESGAELYTIKKGERMLERAYIEALKANKT
jgi:ABC-2 type transport system ATP-binding protein